MNSCTPLRNITNNHTLSNEKSVESVNKKSLNYTDDDFSHLTHDQIKNIIAENFNSHVLWDKYEIDRNIYTVEDRLQIFLHLSNFDWTYVSNEQKVNLESKISRILNKKIVNFKTLKNTCRLIVQKIRGLQISPSSTNLVETTDSSSFPESCRSEKFYKKPPKLKAYRFPERPLAINATSFQKMMELTKNKSKQIHNDEQRQKELENPRLQIKIKDLINKDINENDFFNVTTSMIFPTSTSTKKIEPDNSTIILLEQNVDQLINKNLKNLAIKTSNIN